MLPTFILSFPKLGLAIKVLLPQLISYPHLDLTDLYKTSYITSPLGDGTNKNIAYDYSHENVRRTRLFGARGKNNNFVWRTRKEYQRAAVTVKV